MEAIVQHHQPGFSLGHPPAWTLDASTNSFAWDQPRSSSIVNTTTSPVSSASTVGPVPSPTRPYGAPTANAAFSSTRPPSIASPISSSTMSSSSSSGRTTSINHTNHHNTHHHNNKRASSGDDDAHAAKVKLPRLDRAPEDFSSVVKNRLQSYTRTGQACDRCKVRKIRCDALPEGCSHCTNQNLECYVTDRVTGRTERRGYMQELERDKNALLTRIRDLEKLLADNGITVRPYDAASPYSSSNGNNAGSYPAFDGLSQDKDAEAWTQAGSVWVKNNSAAKSRFVPVFPRSLLESRRQDAHLGVGGDSAPLSSIKGTRLSILGTTIDLASFDAPDIDEPPDDAQIATPLYNKSPQAFLQSTMNINPPVHIELPSREDAFTYSNWYFLTVSTFLPILHKPTFMSLLTRIYDEPNFEPTVSQTVIVHMVFAIIFFQYGVRNRQQVDQFNQLNDVSNKHYHYSLGKFFQLSCSRSLESVQAMAMIASHTRSFPKPGCGAIISNIALQRALELNLHRESRKPGEGTNLEHETRKRVWWAILTAHVAVTGRRGRPMPITVEEFDVGFPEPIADELLTEDGVDTSRSLDCSYHAGLAGFKIIPIYMEMYSNVYSVRRDVGNYTNIVDALEAQVKAWEADLPDHLQLGRTETDQNYMAALYVRMFSLELRLCLRHPSVAMTSDKQLMAENMRTCEDIAREMLRCVQEIQRLKSLDTTWYQLSVYAGAAFSMLAAHWERRFETTPEEIAVLRSEMTAWVGIVEEIGVLLGSGPRITAEFSVIIDRTIATIERDMHSQRNSLPGAASAVKQETSQSAFQVSQAPPLVPSNAGQPEIPSKSYYQNTTVGGQTPYPSLAYGDQTPNSITPSAYDPETAMFYNDPAAAAAAVATSMPDASSSANPLIAFASQATSHVVTQPDMLWQSRGNTWHDWTAAIADSQDRYGAGALLTLGAGARDTVPGPGVSAEASSVPTPDMAISQASQWPLMLFDHSVAGGS